MGRQELNIALNSLLDGDTDDAPRVIEEKTVDDYRKLGDKVDTVISKIKDRKNSRKNKQ
jgi:hypothetical protein